MSEGGERTCPLCAEEMDLTDQHLKPCKCGYEICVWCWHQIMDMAEKDETEGRCPACRSPYNKEKIVGMTEKCEKLVSEMTVEKKLKSQKGKSKSSEGRKHLGSVRVIQRNLVYVVGLPLNFADEDLLQRKEYFVQYGKVLKVSISRAASGAIQQFANSTCSVYITYSKEEEAVRCIQSINGFVLDGKQLRACFGTTKYCHTWLRNMPCSNPDCLYLHEIGSQEDSFTKDEVISAYTRSRVQQLTGVTHSMQRRSGNVLPPPADEYCINNLVSPGKPINRPATNTNQILASNAGVSPPNSSCGRSTALPAGASWGNCASGNLQSSIITPCSSGSLEPDAWNGPVASSPEVASPRQVCLLRSDNEIELLSREQGAISQDKSAQETVEPMNGEFNYECIISVLDSSSTCLQPDTSSTIQPFNNAHTNKPPHDPSKMVDSSVKTRGFSDPNSLVTPDRNIKNICSDFLAMGIHSNTEGINSRENSGAFEEASNMTEEISSADSLSDCRFGILSKETEVDLHETEDDLLSFDNQRIKDPEVIANRSHIPDFFNSFHLSKRSNSPKFSNSDSSSSVGLYRQVVDRQGNLLISASNSPLMSTGLRYDLLSSSVVGHVDYSNLLPGKDKKSLLGRCEGEVSNYSGSARESSIISNTLALDFNSLDDSLTSPQKLAKLLGKTDIQQGVLGAASDAWKIQDSNQSRFSFAREENKNSISDFHSSFGYLEQDFKQTSLCNDFSGNKSLQLDKFVTRNDFPGVSGSASDMFAGTDSHISSNKLSVSRSQISAPPGFSTPVKSPPGFSSFERADHILGTFSGNHMFDASSLLRNQWQTPPSSNTFSNGDIEFMDPAILEVRHGTKPAGISSSVLDIRSNFSPQLSSYEEARLQSFLQRSHSSHQNQRINNLADNFSHMGDAYGVRSRITKQTVASNISPFSQFSLPQSRNTMASNGQWNGWNEGLDNNNSTTEFLRNERLGISKFYGGYEDSKVRLPSSGSRYNGTYGI